MYMSVATRRAAGLVALAALALVVAPESGAAAESTWERIKRTQMLTQGCFPQLPYWYKDKDKPGEWKGWGVSATQQMAKDLEPVGVRGWQCGETTWGTAAMMIQAGKIDYLFAMQATPIRATAITFAGPLYNHGFMAVNSKNFKAQTWDEYNKPTVKIAVQAGTATALVRRFVAPRATAVEMPQEAEAILAVVSGRADAVLVTVINGVVAKQKNPEMGDFVIPLPLFSFPAYVGVANEDDKRFRDFMHWWAEWYRLQGKVEEWIKDSFVDIGIAKDALPDKFYF